MQTENQRPRTLIFSQRNAVHRLPFRCAHFEFEDVIAEIDSSEMMAPRFDLHTRRAAAAKKLAYHTPFVLNPGVSPRNIQAEYDVFLAILGDPSDLLILQSAGNWRAKCAKTVCVIDELWARQIPAYKNYLEMLRQFDLVCLYYSQSVEPLNEIIGEKAIYLPPAVDTVRFCPCPNPPDRSVDLYSIGRRSATTHQSLMGLSAQENLYYIYDTTSADHVPDYVAHRKLYASTLKRSRYFIVNPGLIDRPDVRGSQIEIGYRYFDGVAAGAINVGERPANQVFPELFDWPDPMIDFRYDATNFQEILHHLQKDPAQEAAMRRANVYHALLKHDWAYRWKRILHSIGIAPHTNLFARETRLRNLANLVAPASTHHRKDSNTQPLAPVHA